MVLNGLPRPSPPPIENISSSTLLWQSHAQGHGVDAPRMDGWKCGVHMDMRIRLVGVYWMIGYTLECPWQILRLTAEDQ